MRVLRRAVMAVSDVVGIITNMRIIARPESQIYHKIVKMRIEWAEKGPLGRDLGVKRGNQGGRSLKRVEKDCLSEKSSEARLTIENDKKSEKPE